jgi:hypothetical protein
MGLSKATYYRWKKNAAEGMHVAHHGNLGTKKLHAHILQAMATLQLMLE